MPWCPKCKTEYRPGFDTCADCHVPLVDELPAEPEELDTPAIPPLDLGEPVLLTTVDTTLDADILLAMLTDQGIPAYKKGRGAGAYLSVWMGTASCVEIYVPQLLLEEARELVSVRHSAEGNEELPENGEESPENGEESPEEAEKIKVPLLRKIGHWLLWALLIYISLGLVFGWFIGLFEMVKNW